MSAQDPSGSAAAADPVTSPDDGGSAEVKDKFRAALERKRGQHAERDAASARITGDKIGSEHASAKTKRTFRRKSG